MGLINIFIGLSIVANVSVYQLRDSYFEAAQDQKEITVLLKKVESYPKKDHHYYCYLAAYYSFESKYASNVSLKLKLFKLSKTTLEKSLAIKDNFDARFVRFCIQSNTPQILGYKDKLTEDKKYLLSNIPTLSHTEFKQNVKLFLKQSSLLNKNEKEQLSKL